MTSKITATLVCGLALLLTACESGQPAKPASSTSAPTTAAAPSNVKPAAGADGKVAVVNAFCPIENEHPVKDGRVAVDLVRMWRGQAVGFCCEDCPAGWDALSAGEKDAALAKVT